MPNRPTKIRSRSIDFGVTSAGGSSVHAVGHAQHAQRLLRHAARWPARIWRPHLQASAARGCRPCVCTCVHSSSTMSGAPFVAATIHSRCASRRERARVARRWVDNPMQGGHPLARPSRRDLVDARVGAVQLVAGSAPPLHGGHAPAPLRSGRRPRGSARLGPRRPAPARHRWPAVPPTAPWSAPGDLRRSTGRPVGRNCPPCRSPWPLTSNIAPSAHSAGDGHLVLGQGAGLVRADHRGRAQRLDRRQAADQGMAADHLAHAQRQA